LILSLVALSLLGILVITIQFNKKDLRDIAKEEASNIAKSVKIFPTVKKLKAKHQLVGDRERAKESGRRLSKEPPPTGLKKPLKRPSPPMVIQTMEDEATTETNKSFVAIIIDDCGLSLEVIKMFLDISHEFTFSILPYQPESKKIAIYLHKNDCEIMLHLPMEPQDLEKNDPGSDALLTDLSVGELERRTEMAIRNVPYISGVNNHMGSEFTKHEDLLSFVLKVIGEHGLFFVDSYTTKDSVAYEVSESLGLKTFKRHVFLDNYDAMEEFDKNLEKLIDIAKIKGHAIAIGHAKAQTAENLKRTINLLYENNIRLVRVSDLPQN